MTVVDNNGISVRGIRYPDGRHAFEIAVAGTFFHPDAREPVENPTAMFGRMMDIGIMMSRERRRTVLALIDKVTNFESVDLVRRVGWSGPYFTMPDATVFSPRGAESPRAVFTALPDRCRIAGTLEEWLRTVAVPLTDNYIAEFFMCI